MIDPIVVFLLAFLILGVLVCILQLLDILNISGNSKPNTRLRRKKRRLPTVKEVEDEFIIPDSFDEFSTTTSECLVVILRDQSNVAGICAYLKDKRVEYFRTNLPQCCQDQLANEFEQDYRTVLAAVDFWSPKWMHMEAAHLLTENRNLTA